MKFKEFCAKLWKNKISRIISLIVVVLLIVSVVCVCLNNKTHELDTTYILAKLEKSSELTTAKLTYTGFSEFKDTGISVINKANFIMIYEATARAGIDVKEVKVESDDINRIVWITVPKAKILDVKVNLDSIKYFDEHFALFNWDYKEDANKANSLAEKEAIKELADMGILEMADNQAAALIKGLIQDIVPNDYTIKTKSAE